MPNSLHRVLASMIWRHCYSQYLGLVHQSLPGAALPIQHSQDSLHSILYSCWGRTGSCFPSGNKEQIFLVQNRLCSRKRCLEIIYAQCCIDPMGVDPNSKPWPVMLPHGQDIFFIASAYHSPICLMRFGSAAGGN